MTSKIPNLSERQKILLATIAAAGEKGVSMEQLQATLFLFGEEYPNKLPDDWYEFEAQSDGAFGRKFEDES